MNYKIISSSDKDIDRLIKYKKETIFEHAKDLSDEEIKRINNYINEAVNLEVKNYFNILIDDNIIGSFLITNKDGKILLDEIYIEKEFRNKGIATDIIKNILKKYNNVYLWVYKDNLKAINLYKKLGFIVEEETKTRYYMKSNK